MMICNISYPGECSNNYAKTCFAGCSKESLSAYAESIKDAATALRLSLLEAEVVAVTMYGLSPNQRSRLIFQKLPVTFGDGQLCIHDHNIRFGDRARAQVVSTDRRTGMNRRIEPPTGDIASWVITTNNGHAGQKRCFYCHKVGHLRRNCRVRLEALRTTPVESTSVPLK